MTEWLHHEHNQSIKFLPLPLPHLLMRTTASCRRGTNMRTILSHRNVKLARSSSRPKRGAESCSTWRGGRRFTHENLRWGGHGWGEHTEVCNLR